MTSEFFKLDQRDGVAHLRMNRPEKRNAMSPLFWRELPSLLLELDAEGKTRAAILSAEGPHFCAGMDLSVFSSGDVGGVESAEQREAFVLLVEWLQSVFTTIEKVRFPVIAAIQGACIGGAVDMVSACDMRLATTDATFTIEEINIGMMADLGTLQRLPNLMPEGVVRELAYTGEPLAAERALALGFVNSVHEGEARLIEHAELLARKIAAKPPLAIAASKRMIRFARDHSVAEGLAQAAALQGAVFNPADLMRSFQAKVSKQAPNFDDLHRHKRSLE